MHTHTHTHTNTQKEKEEEEERMVVIILGDEERERERKEPQRLWSQAKWSRLELIEMLIKRKQSKRKRRTIICEKTIYLNITTTKMMMMMIKIKIKWLKDVFNQNNQK